MFPLPLHRDQRLLGARRRFRQGDEFGDAQARGVDQLDQARHARRGEPFARRTLGRVEPLARNARSADRPRRRSGFWAAGGRGAGPRSPGSDRRRAVPRHRDACGTAAPRKAGARARPRRGLSAPRAAMKARTSALDGIERARAARGEEVGIVGQSRAGRPRWCCGWRRARRRSRRERTRRGDGPRAAAARVTAAPWGCATICVISRGSHLHVRHQRDHAAVDEAGEHAEDDEKAEEGGHRVRPSWRLIRSGNAPLVIARSEAKAIQCGGAA